MSYLGGNSIQQECARYVSQHGQLMDGEVFTSSAGRLACKKIIHAVGPKWQGGRSQEEHTLITCIDNCFEEAEKHKIKSIAIPPVSTGIFEYPLEKAVKAIVDAVCDREKQGDYLPEYITFVDNKVTSWKIFKMELEQRSWISQPLQGTTPVMYNAPAASQPPKGSHYIILYKIAARIVTNHIWF